MENEKIIFVLAQIYIETQHRLFAVKRKRSMRESEKIMATGHYNNQMKAISCAIKELKKKAPIAALQSAEMKLVTHAEIVVPFDGDEAKAQRLANALAGNAGDMYTVIKNLLLAFDVPHLKTKHMADGSALKAARLIVEKIEKVS